MRRMLASLAFTLGLLMLTVGLYADQLDHLKLIIKLHVP